MTDPLLLSTQQAAERLGVSEKFLEHLRVVGGGPEFIKPKGRGRGGFIVRYTPAALEAWVAAQPRFKSTTEADGVS